MINLNFISNFKHIKETRLKATFVDRGAYINNNSDVSKHLKEEEEKD